MIRWFIKGYTRCLDHPRRAETFETRRLLVTLWRPLRHLRRSNATYYYKLLPTPHTRLPSPVPFYIFTFSMNPNKPFMSTYRRPFLSRYLSATAASWFSAVELAVATALISSAHQHTALPLPHLFAETHRTAPCPALSSAPARRRIGCCSTGAGCTASSPSTAVSHRSK